MIILSELEENGHLPITSIALINQASGRALPSFLTIRYVRRRRTKA